MRCFACVVAQAVDSHVSLLVSLLYLVVHVRAGFLVDACVVLAVLWRMLLMAAHVKLSFPVSLF